jgi:hypothetical protein
MKKTYVLILQRDFVLLRDLALASFSERAISTQSIFAASVFAV